MITTDLILEKCKKPKHEVISFFRDEVFWMELEKIETMYDLMLKTNTNQIQDFREKVNFIYLEYSIRMLLDDIYDFKRNQENNWERFRKVS